MRTQVEEQPRKLESVIQVSTICLNSQVLDPAKEKEFFQEQAQDLVFNENVLLQTLGFDVAVDHPHTHVVKTCHLVKGEPRPRTIGTSEPLIMPFSIHHFSLQRISADIVFLSIE